jgi:hypothetical protein
MDKQLKTKYKIDFSITSAIVNEFDICGLITGEAPNDEYDSLTNIILSSIYNKKSHSETKEKLIQLLTDYFGMDDSIKERDKTTLNQTLDSLLDRIETELESFHPN